MSALRWFVSPSSLLLFVKAYLRLCSQRIFLYCPNYVEPILLVLRLASATPMSLWSSNLAMRSSSIQTSSTHLPRFEPWSNYSTLLLMQSQYVVMLFPTPWIFFSPFLLKMKRVVMDSHCFQNHSTMRRYSMIIAYNQRINNPLK